VITISWFDDIVNNNLGFLENIWESYGWWIVIGGIIGMIYLTFGRL